MKMFMAGQWTETTERLEVTNKFDGQLVDTVPKASAGDIQRAITSAVQGAAVMRQTTGYDRARILRTTAELIDKHAERMARLISAEEGKVLAEARLEVALLARRSSSRPRRPRRLTGEVLPLDGAPGAAGKLGFTLRVPCGVVAAITPFNFPLNLVCHKVGPALAAGNAVVLKPASDTPLSALALVELLLEAGLHPLAINCVTGSGATVGDAICSDPRVRKISFTGSREVGEHICKTAGIKRVTMELGSNSPIIVMPDADLEKVAHATAVTGYANAGQVCISTQRLIAIGPVYDDVISAVRPKVEAISVGDPLDEKSTMGPMIREADAQRVESWINEAVAGGARVVTGGGRRGAIFEPTLLADVDPQHARQLPGTVRTGGWRHPGKIDRRGDSHRQRFSLRPGGRHFYGEHLLGHAVRAPSRQRQPEHQLGAAVARRPDAVRRVEGKRLRQGRAEICHRRNERAKNRDRTRRVTCGPAPLRARWGCPPLVRVSSPPPQRATMARPVRPPARAAVDSGRLLPTGSGGRRERCVPKMPRSLPTRPAR